MKNTLEYKGYLGSVIYSPNDGVLIGELLGIADNISYHGSSVSEVQAAFIEAVDDYLETCAEIGKKPEVSYNGNLSDIKISPNLHRQLFAFSISQSKSPSQLVEEALNELMTQRV